MQDIGSISVRLSLLLLLALLLPGVLSEEQPEKLQLNHPHSVELQPNRVARWELDLNSSAVTDSDLYLTVQSPANSPLQQPHLTIATNSQKLRECYTDNNQFSSICRVSGNKLTPNTQVFLTAECKVKCHLTITAELAKRLRLSLESVFVLKATSDSSEEFEFQVQVPEDENFTNLAFYAQIADYQVGGGSLELYANLGDKSTAIPSEKDYQVAGESIFWGGLGLYFDKKDFKGGKNWIKIFVSLSPGMQVKVYFRETVGNDFMIELGSAYFDFTTRDEAKGYYLDLSKEKEKIKGKTVSLGFIIYAGQPSITVGLDSKFEHTLHGRGSFGTITYLISQSLRNSTNFNGTIYIVVSSAWNADFYFYSAITEENSLTISPNIAYYNQLGQGEVFNYFYSDMLMLEQGEKNQSSRRKYAAKVDMFAGEGDFGVRRCQAGENTDDSVPCLINSTDQFKDPLVKKSFEEITVTVKKTGTFYQLLFEYDLSRCQFFNGTTKTYYCFFQAVGFNLKKKQLDYTFLVEKRAYAARMKEGQVRREAIFQNQYLYYRFGLTSTDGVEEVSFFITVTEGDVFMLGSTSDPFPSFDTNGSLKTSTSNRLTFQKDQLSTAFFLSVTGLQFSQFTIGVVVNRQGKPDENSSNQTVPSQKTRIKLQLDLTQQFTLKIGEEEALFEISAFSEELVTLSVVELVGAVSMEVAKAGGGKAQCLDRPATTNSEICDLQLQKGDNYNIDVRGQKGREQKFAISYSLKESCSSYSLGLPYYKQLAVGSRECVTFSIGRVRELELTVSISIDQLLSGNLQLQLCINGKCVEQSISNHYLISADLLTTLCQLKGSTKQSCPISVHFINNATSNLNFDLILQEKGQDVALFDGIAEKVTSSDLTATTSKHLYFQVYSNSTIRIFFTSLTTDTFVILAHFVGEKAFLQNYSSAYLGYDPKQQDQNRTNFYKFYKYGAGSTLFAIPSTQIQKYCQKCVLTLSIYSIYKPSAVSQSIFDVEVSQQETGLTIGQSKIGYLEEEDIFVFQLEQPTSSDALISIRDLSKESSSQKNCFKASLSGNGAFSEEAALIIPTNSTQLSVFVQGVSKICEFQISYTSLKSSIRSANQNYLYSFDIKENTSAYFLYTHYSQEPFKIVQIISSGSSKVSVSPVSSTKSLKDLVLQNPSLFPFTFEANQGEMFISNSSASFCTSCQYLIAVSTEVGAKGELLIANPGSRIPLSLKGILREKIKVSETKVRYYEFNSLVGFNITISMIFGRVKVTVLGPDGALALQKEVDSSTVLNVPRSKSTQNYTYEYNSYATAFKINVEAQVDSFFTIKASKVDISRRIFEGVGAEVYLMGSKPVVLQFFNFNTNLKHRYLNILIEVVRVLQTSKARPKINIEAAVASTQSNDPEPVRHKIRRNKDSTINVKLPEMKGDYFITLSCNLDVSVNIILVKQSLIHLTPQKNMLGFREHTFELYSPQKSVMLEVFACEGEIGVEASQDFRNFQSDAPYDEVVLEQKNYGGHFVINSQNVYGQYFVRVKNRGVKVRNITYLLYYYYYDQGDEQPYKLVDLRSPEITYSLGQDTIRFAIEPLRTQLDSKSKVKELLVDYRFYISDSKNRVSNYANCRLGEVEEKKADKVTTREVALTLQSDSLSSLSDVYFIGAEAVVTVVLKNPKDSQHYPSELNLIYDVIQITNTKLPPSSQDENTYSAKTVILFMLLPFGLAGLALYLAVRFCLKKYRGMVPDDFVEENVGESEEVVHGGRPSSSNASGTFKFDN